MNFNLTFLKKKIRKKFAKNFHFNFLLLRTKVNFFFFWFNFLFKYKHFFFSPNLLFFNIKAKRCFRKNLVTKERVFKDFSLKFFNYSNLTFFKEKPFVHLNNLFVFNKVVYKISEVLFLYKNFNVSKTNCDNVIFRKNFKKFFFRNLNSNNFFFVKYIFYGLGFKLKKKLFYNQRILSLDIGFGHRIIYLLPEAIKCFCRKKHFFFFSNNYFLLNNISFHFSKFKPLNSYKIRGIKNIKMTLSLKKGKKQNQKK